MLKVIRDFIVPERPGVKIFVVVFAVVFALVAILSYIFLSYCQPFFFAGRASEMFYPCGNISQILEKIFYQLDDNPLIFIIYPSLAYVISCTIVYMYTKYRN